MSKLNSALLLLAVFVIDAHSLALHDDGDAVMSYSDDNNQVDPDFVENNILRGIDTSVRLCDDPYRALCGTEETNYTRPAHLKQAYPFIRNELINLLSQPITANEVASLSTEKALFHKCMNLGLKGDRENNIATGNFLRNLFERAFSVGGGWQMVDNQLNLRGFDFTFFDIAVERDPENPRQNVIVLRPPSYARVQDLYELLKIAFDPSKGQSDFALKFYDGIDREAVQQFFRHWTKLFAQSSTQRNQEKMSLIQWNEQYNSTSSVGETSKINWQKLIKRNFARVNIGVVGSERIWIRNKDYFLRLRDLLGNNSNEVIVGALKSKLVLENMRYIDYKYADALRHRKRSLQCYSDTKLYGASYKLLRDLKKGIWMEQDNYAIVQRMLGNIADVLLFAIDVSKSLSSLEKSYLKAQVKLMTMDAVKTGKYRNIIDDYYENYEIAQSYFASIVNYRKMLKEKELTSLIAVQSKQLTEMEAFSVIDLAKPRNRFILNVLANSFLLEKLEMHPGLQKEVHYGIYGVNMASFLFGLLNENGFDNAVKLNGRVDWYDHPDYAAKSLKCFLGEDASSYGWGLASQTITQIFGAQIAYKAMLKDYAQSQQARPTQYLHLDSHSQMKPIAADQLFFIAYAKYHCHLGHKVLKTILLNLHDYNSAFECSSNSVAQCRLNGFQMQSKHFFVNKPF